MNQGLQTDKHADDSPSSRPAGRAALWDGTIACPRPTLMPPIHRSTNTKEHLVCNVETRETKRPYGAAWVDEVTLTPPFASPLWSLKVNVFTINILVFWKCAGEWGGSDPEPNGLPALWLKTWNPRVINQWARLRGKPHHSLIFATLMWSNNDLQDPSLLCTDTAHHWKLTSLACTKLVRVISCPSNKTKLLCSSWFCRWSAFQLLHHFNRS